MDESLVLDSAIRDWVLIPIAVVMFFVPILRANLTRLMATAPPPPDRTELFELYCLSVSLSLPHRHSHPLPLMARCDALHRQVVAKSQILRANSSVLSAASFAARREYLVNKDTGLLHRDIKTRGAMEKMMDPNNAMTMMKKNITMVMSQMLMMFWVSHFFSGFILGIDSRLCVVLVLYCLFVC
jgi:ER membrane protein complex subunit 3